MPGPFWIGYHIQDCLAREMLDSIANLVENPVSPEDLHMTLFYSGDNPPEKEWPRIITVSTRAEITGFALLGDALVALLEPSQILKSRFEDVKKDYPTTFPYWIPHITIGYRSNVEELSLVQSSTSLSLAAFADAPLYVYLAGEFINDPKDPDEGADEAGISMIDVSARNNLPKLEKLMGRGGLLRAFNTALAKSPTINKAWDNIDFDSFKASCITVLNQVRETWDLKNTLLEEKKNKKGAK